MDLDLRYRSNAEMRKNVLGRENTMPSDASRKQMTVYLVVWMMMICRECVVMNV